MQDAPWLDDVLGALASGRKIEAIRLYREATGAGLAEAKAAVEAIGAGAVPRPAAGPGADDVTAALVAGRKIEAIKLYRAATGASLADAKHHVDAMQARLPVSSGNPGARPALSPRSTMMSVILFAVLLAIVAAVAAWLFAPHAPHGAALTYY